MPNPDIGKLAKQANNARNSKLTPEQRSQIASIAAKKRWANAQKKQNHSCQALCRCECGRLKYKHVTQESQEEFKCTSWKENI